MINITAPYENELTSEEKVSIDKFINDTINSLGNNVEQLTQLAMQASTAINANESRINKLKSQSLWRTLLGNFTGANRKIRGNIDRDFAAAQNASIKMISKLADQNKLTFNAIVAIDSKINCVTSQLKDIAYQMNNMMNSAMDIVIRDSLRIDKLERSVKVIQLESTIEFLSLDGVPYKNLDDKTKIACIISDFFYATDGKYSLQDLMMIKPMMSKLGLNPNDKTNMISIYEALINNSTVNSRFIEKLDRNKLNKIDDFEIPFLYALKDLNSNRNTASINNYAVNNLNIDLSKDIDNFELSVSLLNELSYVKNYDSQYSIGCSMTENLSHKEIRKLLYKAIFIAKYIKDLKENRKIRLSYIDIDELEQTNNIIIKKVITYLEQYLSREAYSESFNYNNVENLFTYDEKSQKNLLEPVFEYREKIISAISCQDDIGGYVQGYDRAALKIVKFLRKL